MQLHRLFKMSIPTFLRPMRAVVTAIIGLDGLLIDANSGFLGVIGADSWTSGPLDVRSQFANPTFAQLIAKAGDTDGPLHQGILNLGANGHTATSVIGNVHACPKGLWLAAEHDIARLDQLNRSVTALNEQLAGIQRDLVRANRDLRRRESEITKLMLTDPLTELPNRRACEEALKSEVARVERYGTGLSVALADIDHFKSINDKFGHERGDAVLKAVASAFRRELRANELLGRWGGEEFLVVLPGAGLATAVTVLDRARAAVAAELPLGSLRPVTISAGVAELAKLEPGQSVDIPRLLRAADIALYAAKVSGRDRVVADDGKHLPMASQIC